MCSPSLRPESYGDVRNPGGYNGGGPRQAVALAKHPMAEAVHYALSQGAELTVFCSDGAVPMDNNISEGEMK